MHWHAARHDADGERVFFCRAPPNGIIITMKRAARLERAVALAQRCWPLPLALFVARVALEASGRALPGGIVLGVAASALLAAGLLAWWPRGRRSRASLPPWLLLVYVCWPSRNPVVAASVALTSALSWLFAPAPGRQPAACRGAALPAWVPHVADGAVFATALAVYVATLSPDVLPADAGEFQLVAARWGVAHPPGFPLYTLAGGLFVRLMPFSSPACRLNLLSAVLAAGTLVLVARATRTWAALIAPDVLSTSLALASGIAAALALGTATTFWAQATIANIRTPAAFCAALILAQLAQFASATRRATGGSEPIARREADRALAWLGVALGLGLGHHPSLVFAAVFYVLYVFVSDPHLAVEPRRWWRLGLLLPVGLAPYIYLPLRGAAGAPLAPAGLDTLAGFLHHVRAEGFAGDMFAYANVADLPHRLALLPTLWPFQFNLGLLVAAAAGLVLLVWRDWRLFTLLAGSLVLHTFVTITYRAPQTVEYLMPGGYPPVAIAVGLAPVLVGSAIGIIPPTARGPGQDVQRGLLRFARNDIEVERQAGSLDDADNLEAISMSRNDIQMERRVGSQPGTALLAAAVLTAGLLNGWAHGPSFAVLARDRSTRAHVGPLLESAPSGALILADWHWATPLWYLQQVEGRRQDVEVHYVYNVPGEEYRDTWRARVEEADPDRPLILTHFYEFGGYTGEPWWTGFRVHTRPLMAPTAPLTPLLGMFGERFQVLGYRLAADSGQPGGMLECVLAWQSLGPLDQAHSLTLRLYAPDGRLVAQADQALAMDVEPGEVRFERLMLPLYPWLTPGRYRLTLGAYLSGPAGFVDLPVSGATAETPTSVSLTALPIAAALEAPYTLHPQFVPFARGPALVGVDYDRSQPETLRVYLRLRGPIPSDCQAQLAGDGASVAIGLPAIPARAYQTVVADLPGGVARLRLALICGGAAVDASGLWGWALPSVVLPRAVRDARFVPLGADMAVVGTRARTAPAGATARVDVTLVALRPLVDDIATSVRMMASDGRWLTRHDMQPALGAVPTLKWIRGSRVMDRHLLPVPPDFRGEAVQAALVAYERFRQTTQVVLDERFAQVPLGSWPQP
jgi:hypothetical protein